jgi:hypothetical protein
LAVLVVAFAFLVSSFLARNADFWLHLATGRLIAHGSYTFGVDPFAYTTADVYWANRNWLYDWVLFLLYGAIGGAWLVVFKAALIAALAGLMLMIRQQSKPGWAPVFCTALAVLAMSPWLLLQPRCVSMALLGLSLWLLWRGRAPSARPRRWWWGDIDARLLLIPICALWVNLDDWFLLGPVLVGLFWLGDRIQPRAAWPPGMRPTPLWLLPVCLLACLCSPHHVFAFTLPGDLYPLPFSGGLLQDARFQRLSASPWQIDAGFHSPAGANIAGLAYFALVVVGAASFALNLAALRDWRVFTWAAFALLGAWQARLIPFFAVIGGPVAALNLQGMKVALPTAVAFWLRAACLAFLFALVGLAVPGWVLGFSQAARQVAWGVEADPSLRRAADVLHGWRDHKLLDAGERSFAMHPDAACYLAWFCPDEKSFFDTRVNLFSRQAADYAAVCRALDPALAAPGFKEPLPNQPDFPLQTLTDQHVSVVLIYDPDPQKILPVLARLYRDHAGWALLSVDGQCLIFGWNQARLGLEAEPFAGMRFDATRLALGAPDEEAPAAPAAGPGRDPKEPDWTAHFGPPPMASPWESATSTTYMRLFDDDLLPGRAQAVDQYYLTASGGFAGVLGLPAGGAPTGGAPALVMPLIFRLAAVDESLPEYSDKPPDLPLLAVRAARRAVAADPDDASAYLRLGQAYLALRNNTAENTRGGAFGALRMLRDVQIATALRQALMRNPDLEAAHEFLADLFLEHHYYDFAESRYSKDSDYCDAALVHRQAQLRLAQRAGRRPGEDADANKRRMDDLSKQVDSLDKFVKDHKEVYAIRSRQLGDDALKKAELSLQLGLGAQALDDILMQARVEVQGSALAQRELEQLLLLGRAREAKEKLDDPDMAANKHKLTTYVIPSADPSQPAAACEFPTYEWFQTCAAAALGGYDFADAALQETGGRLADEAPLQRQAYAKYVPMELSSEIGVLAQPRPVPVPLPVLWSENRDLQTRIHFFQAWRADLLTLRGMLDLERGAPADGRRRLQEGVDLLRSSEEPGPAAVSAPLAEAYLKLMHPAGR